MNRKNLEGALVNAPEMSIKVSAGLHQDIMRAIRQVEPAGRGSVSRGITFSRAIPAWTMGALAVIVAAVIFYPSQTITISPAPNTAVVPSQVQNPAGYLLSRGERLLTISEQTPAPEAELRKEIQRLKSDLARFDFRS